MQRHKKFAILLPSHLHAASFTYIPASSVWTQRSSVISKLNMSKLRVYTTRGSPPSTAVLATLAALELSCDEVQLDYMAGEHLSDEHEKRKQDTFHVEAHSMVNDPPSFKFCLDSSNLQHFGKSVAIMQYLCECHGGEAGTKLYPRDPKQRAIVNQRLAYNMSSFYKNVGEFSFGKMFGLPGDPEVWKTNNQKALKTLETIFSRQGTRFAAGG
ncbi:hypothetical protein B566_EDAN002020, partial [Ephemera danica]